MPAARRRKKITYTLQVTVTKPEGVNETELLNKIRSILSDNSIKLEGVNPRVSVMKKLEEFV